MKRIALIAALIALLPVGAVAQTTITPILYGGFGVSSSLKTGTKSMPVFLGAKFSLSLPDKWCAQVFVAGSRIVPSTGPSWSTVQVGTMAGRRIGQTRFTPFVGLMTSHNRVGDYLPTVFGATAVRLHGRWVALGLVSRNSQSWGSRVSVGYAFKPLRIK
jgi:hypothetical protein